MNVQGMDITSERKLQGTDITSEMNVWGTNITCVRNVQGTNKCLIDGDHTDGHYNTMFAEQLTRTFEVLVVLELLSSLKLFFRSARTSSSSSVTLTCIF